MLNTYDRNSSLFFVQNVYIIPRIYSACIRYDILWIIKQLQTDPDWPAQRLSKSDASSVMRRKPLESDRRAAPRQACTSAMAMSIRVYRIGNGVMHASADFESFYASALRESVDTLHPAFAKISTSSALCTTLVVSRVSVLARACLAAFHA